jgi:GTPase SAR1 family protein
VQCGIRTHARLPEDVPDAYGIIFVLDSHDRERAPYAMSELNEYVLNTLEARGLPIVVAANKQDLPGVMTTYEIAQELKLADLRQPWHVIVSRLSCSIGWMLIISRRERRQPRATASQNVWSGSHINGNRHRLSDRRSVKHKTAKLTGTGLKSHVET